MGVPAKPAPVAGRARKPCVAVVPGLQGEALPFPLELDVVRTSAPRHPEGTPEFALVLSIDFHSVVRRRGATDSPCLADFVVVDPGVDDDPTAGEGQFEGKQVAMGMTRDVVGTDGRRIADDIMAGNAARPEITGLRQSEGARRGLRGAEVPRRARNPERRVVEERDVSIGVGEMGQRRENAFERRLYPFAQGSIARPTECPEHPGNARLVERRALEMPPVGEHLLGQFAIEQSNAPPKPTRAILAFETGTGEREGSGIFEQVVAA